MNIYNINNIELKSVIYVYSECDEGQTIRYGDSIEYYELIYCLDGENEVLFQNTKLYDKTGYIRFLPVCANNNGYRVTNIKSGEVIDIFFKTENHMPDFAISRNYSSNKNIRKLFIKLYHIWSKKETGYYNKCVSIFFDILYEMQKSDSGVSHHSHIKKIANGVDFIHNHYCEITFDYEKLADLCGISYTYFKKLFRETYNITPSEYIRTLRMKKACELLLTKRFSVSQVAEMCGYENIYYFSKVFKNEIGIPPSKYQNKH